MNSLTYLSQSEHSFAATALPDADLPIVSEYDRTGDIIAIFAAFRVRFMHYLIFCLYICQKY